MCRAKLIQHALVLYTLLMNGTLILNYFYNSQLQPQERDERISIIPYFSMLREICNLAGILKSTLFIKLPLADSVFISIVNIILLVYSPTFYLHDETNLVQNRPRLEFCVLFYQEKHYCLPRGFHGFGLSDFQISSEIPKVVLILL